MNWKSRRAAQVWLLAVLLAICVLISFLLLGMILRDLAADSHTVIPLAPGQKPGNLLTAKLYRQAAEEPEMHAYDEQAKWDVVTKVDLFKTAYKDPLDRDITVESGNGDKVIAPGTTNDYTFSLRNTGNISLDYTLRLEGLFELTNKKLPFQVRLKKADAWLVGSDESWSTVDELNAVVDQGSIPVGQELGYLLQWQWPYESGQDDMLVFHDLNDSVIGSAAAAAEAGVNFQLTIQTVSQVTPGAVPMDAGGNALYEELVNPLTFTAAGGSIIGGGLILLLLLFLQNTVYVTGFVPAMAGQTIQCGRKSDTLRPDGRFVFARMPLGKHTFALNPGPGQLRWKLKRDRKAEGIRFETDEGFPTVVVGKGIIALELQLLPAGPMLELQRLQWAAIDKEHNVYTPLGRKAPDTKGCNRTPDGLKIDEKGKLEIGETVKV